MGKFSHPRKTRDPRKAKQVAYAQDNGIMFGPLVLSTPATSMGGGTSWEAEKAERTKQIVSVQRRARYKQKKERAEQEKVRQSALQHEGQKRKLKAEDRLLAVAPFHFPKGIKLPISDKDGHYVCSKTVKVGGWFYKNPRQPMGMRSSPWLMPPTKQCAKLLKQDYRMAYYVAARPPVHRSLPMLLPEPTRPCTHWRDEFALLGMKLPPAPKPAPRPVTFPELPLPPPVVEPKPPSPAVKYYLASLFQNYQYKQSMSFGKNIDIMMTHPPWRPGVWKDLGDGKEEFVPCFVGDCPPKKKAHTWNQHAKRLMSL